MKDPHFEVSLSRSPAQDSGPAELSRPTSRENPEVQAEQTEQPSSESDVIRKVPRPQDQQFCEYKFVIQDLLRRQLPNLKVSFGMTFMARIGDG